MFILFFLSIWFIILEFLSIWILQIFKKFGKRSCFITESLRISFQCLRQRQCISEHPMPVCIMLFTLLNFFKHSIEYKHPLIPSHKVKVLLSFHLKTKVKILSSSNEPKSPIGLITKADTLSEAFKPNSYSSRELSSQTTTENVFIWKEALAPHAATLEVCTPERSVHSREVQGLVFIAYLYSMFEILCVYVPKHILYSICT